MQRLTSIGVALLMTASVSVATSAASTDATDTATDTKVQKEKLTKEEKVLAKGKTKVVKFKDEKGKVKYAATVGVDAEVKVIETGNDGVYEMSVTPHDPTTEEEM